MNPIKKPGRNEVSSKHLAAPITGFMFLFSLLVPSLNWALGLSKLIEPTNAVATAKNILDNELLFRIGLAVELVMASGLVVLAIGLYTILKSVHRPLARLALFLKIVEAGLVGVIVLISFAALQALTGSESVSAFTPDQMLVPVGILLNNHATLYSIPMFFLGLDLMLFFYLFYKSRYIPRILAGFGIFSYFLILINSMGTVLAPQLVGGTGIQAIFFTPSCIAELAIGIWLLVKGLQTEYA